MKLVSVVLLLLAPVLTSCAPLELPADCSDIYHHDNSRPSGVYNIYPIGTTSAVQVYCDMDSLGGRWTVFQRRMDGSVNFYRPWNEYKDGFGSATGEYWLGLDSLHQLTQRRKVELLVDMEDFDGNKAFAHYSSFSVESQYFEYKLNVSGFTDGGAGDGLSSSSGQKFLTLDKDSYVNCAHVTIGAFWYGSCGGVNPNGVYRWGADDTLSHIGVEWPQWKGYDSLKAISMKIRPVY